MKESQTSKSQELDAKNTQGRWSRDEHEKFIEGKRTFQKNNCLAMDLYKRDWKHVEAYIGTRSGAQIRSHAQKFSTRIEKDHADPDEYIRNKAKQLREAKQSGTIRDASTNFDFDDESHLEVTAVAHEEIKASQPSTFKEANRLRTVSVN